MRSVDDIFQSEIGFGPGHQIEIEGWLVVAKPLSYLTASESKEENAFLVIAPGLYEQFLDQLAVRCRTMVGFCWYSKNYRQVVKNRIISFALRYLQNRHTYISGARWKFGNIYSRKK